MGLGQPLGRGAGPVCGWRSERIAVGERWWIGPVKVVLGALIVEAMDLREVVRFEAGDQVVEKLEQIDGRLIGQWRRRDADGASAMCHGGWVGSA